MVSASQRDGILQVWMDYNGRSRFVSKKVVHASYNRLISDRDSIITLLIKRCRTLLSYLRLASDTTVLFQGTLGPGLLIVPLQSVGCVVESLKPFDNVLNMCCSSRSRFVAITWIETYIYCSMLVSWRHHLFVTITVQDSALQLNIAASRYLAYLIRHFKRLMLFCLLS